MCVYVYCTRSSVRAGIGATRGREPDPNARLAVQAQEQIEVPRAGEAVGVRAEATDAGPAGRQPEAPVVQPAAEEEVDRRPDRGTVRGGRR